MDPKFFHTYSKKPVVYYSSDSDSSSEWESVSELESKSVSELEPDLEPELVSEVESVFESESESVFESDWESYYYQDEVDATNEITDNLSDLSVDEDWPPGDSFSDSDDSVSVRRTLEQISERYADQEVLPDLVLELIQENQLNIMIIDLYSYAKGFEVSFLKFGADEEMFHGAYSHGMGLIDYIKDCEIPYELFDHFHHYDFRLIYEGYLICQLRMHFDKEDNIQSHFVLLRHTIQTIDAECAMICASNENLNFDTERARLIQKYSPDLCLDPNLDAVKCFKESVLNEFPFLSPELKHVINNKKADLEAGLKKFEDFCKSKNETASKDEQNESICTLEKRVDSWEGIDIETGEETSKEKLDPLEGTSKDMPKGQVDPCEGTSQEVCEETSTEQVNPCEETCDEITALVKKFEACSLLDWDEVKEPASPTASYLKKRNYFSPSLAHFQDSKYELTSPIASYLKNRKIYFPGLEHFQDSKYVEIENFVFEYTAKSNIGKLETIREKLSVSVINRDGYYYVAYQRDDNEKMSWSPLGRRKEFGLLIDEITKENMKYNKGEMKITRNRLFDNQRIEVVDGVVNFLAEKLKHPVSQVFLHLSAPEKDKDEEDDMDIDGFK